MIFWHTDNELSQIIGKATGLECRHISQFNPLEPSDPHVFYGIHRGTGNAMSTLKWLDVPYYYIDNGYFDAEYIDRSGRKDLNGTYRVVKNGTHEKYIGPSYEVLPGLKKCLLIPPSPYSAYFNDTTPEDWLQWVDQNYPDMHFTVRTKASNEDLESAILAHDCVLAFNSMAIMKAIDLKRPVADMHGILQNKSFRKYKSDDVRDFYASKQFTIEQLGSVDWKSV